MITATVTATGKTANKPATNVRIGARKILFMTHNSLKSKASSSVPSPGNFVPRRRVEISPRIKLLWTRLAHFVYGLDPRHDFVNVTRLILIKWTKGKIFGLGGLLSCDCSFFWVYGSFFTVRTWPGFLSAQG